MKGKKRITLLAVLACVFALVFSLGIMSACGNSETASDEGGQWLYGTTAPAENLGNTGDYYLDTETLTAYVRTAEEGWKETALFSGSGKPVDTEGRLGDLYLDAESGELYQKGESAWAKVLTLRGEKGRDGVVWFSGKIAPNTYPAGDNTLKDAKKGDFYLNTETFEVYQLGTDGTWNLLGTIKGKDGAAGTTPQAPNYTVSFDARTSAGAVLDLETIKKQDQRNADKWSTDGEYITYRVEKGDSIENLPVPTLAHCTFLGWYTGLGANDAQITTLTPITRSLHLVARYAFNDTTHVASMTKGGAEVANGSNETLIWKTGRAAADYKADYNFKVVAAETDNIQIYVKRGTATPTVWGKGNSSSGTVKRAAWNAGVYDITITGGYFSSVGTVTKDNFEKYLVTPTNINVYTVRVVRNGDWENPLASFTTHFEAATSTDTSKPFTEQGKSADLTDAHGANWSDVQAGQTVRESFIISHDALTVGAQPKITMKVTAWTSDTASIQYYTKDAPQYEETFVYTLNPDGASFSVERTAELCRGDDWNNPKEDWTPRGEDGWVSEWNYNGYIKVTAVKLSNGFLEFIVESNYTATLNSLKVYHHTVSLVYELGDTKLDVLGNNAEDFDGTDPTAAELNVRTMTEASWGTSEMYAGTPKDFTLTIKSPDHQSTVRPTIEKDKLDYIYFIIDGVRADFDLEGHTTINERDFSFQVDVVQNGQYEIRLNFTQFIFNTDGTKQVERYYSYRGVERVNKSSMRVIPVDAAQNANELILKAWEKYLLDHDLIEGEPSNYTLKAVPGGTNATLMLNYINQMNAGTIDYQDATLNDKFFPRSFNSTFGSIMTELGMPDEWTTLTELYFSGAPDPDALADFNAGVEKQNTMISQRMQELAKKYTVGSHVPTTDMLYTYYAENIIPHFDDSKYGHGLDIKTFTYCLFYGLNADLTGQGESNVVQSTIGIYLRAFRTPEIAMNFLELAFEKYGDIDAAEFYEEIYEAFDAADSLSEDETAAFEALTAAEATLQAAGGLDSADEAIVSDYMEKLQALCVLYGQRVIGEA